MEIPPSAVDEQFRDGWLFHITYSNSVGDYEAMLQAVPEGDFPFRGRWTPSPYCSPNRFGA